MEGHQLSKLALVQSGRGAGVLDLSARIHPFADLSGDKSDPARPVESQVMQNSADGTL